MLPIMPMVFGGIGALGVIKVLKAFKPETLEDSKFGAEELKKRGQKTFENLVERIYEYVKETDKK